MAHRLLPAAICQRRKQGFCLPMRQWLSDYLTSDNIESLVSTANSGIDAKKTASYLNQEVRAGVVRERLTYALIVLARWAEFAEGHIRRLRTELTQTAVSAA
jgi:hypothetical protein